jgi:hypothetical protein
MAQNQQYFSKLDQLITYFQNFPVTMINLVYMV